VLGVFICEDNIPEKEKITECVRNYITLKGLCMEIALSSGCPRELLDHRRASKVDGLYFLDMELNADINGLELAEQIRELDPRGFIVFITSHADMLHLTFKYKVEAMDYITKDTEDISERIFECIDKAYTLYSLKPSGPHDKFVINISKSRYVSLNRCEILYFEAVGGHMIYVHSENGRYLFGGNLNKIQSTLGSDFFRCHKSVLVNLSKITELKMKEKEVMLGSNAKCIMSARCAGKLRDRIGAHFK
jgi:two-component system response regulator AgrA